MRMDPKELRGVGIQITKLDGEKPAVVEREPGQGALKFSVKPAAPSKPELMEKAEPKQQVEVSEAVMVQKGKAKEADSPSPVSAPPQARLPLDGVHPSSEGIDPDFLAALPPSLQEEVQRDYETTRKARKRSKAHSVPPEPVQESESPSIGRHAAAHITRQLRPKVKTQLKAGAVAELPLYSAWAQAGQADSESGGLEAESSRRTEKVGKYLVSELEDLSIDPDVFGALPEDMREEIILEERRKARQRKLLHRPADTSRLPARERERALQSASPSSNRAYRAGSIPAQTKAQNQKPLVAVSLPQKPSLLKATALPDVLDTITRWIDSRKGAAPAEKDAAKVRTYLVKCFDEGMGMQASENAVEVLKWMRLEIGLRWGGPSVDDDAGQAWWVTWRGFRQVVDELAVKRFGAPLRL